MGIEVHLRSIFLNGLLFLPPDRAPHHLKAAASRISRARRLIAEGRSDPLQAALGFALSRVEAATVLVGVTSAGRAVGRDRRRRPARLRTWTGTRWPSTIRSPSTPAPGRRLKATPFFRSSRRKPELIGWG